MLPSPGNLRPVKDKKQALRYLCLGERMINMSLEWSNKSETEKEKFRSVLASMTLNIMETSGVAGTSSGENATQCKTPWRGKSDSDSDSDL